LRQDLSDVNGSPWNLEEYKRTFVDRVLLSPSVAARFGP